MSARALICHPDNEAWTSARVELLKHLVEVEKLSARQIGDQMGVSRCAIIGKVHRAGLRLHRKKGPQPFMGKRVSERARKFPFLVQQRELKPPQIPTVPIPEFKSIGIVEVAPDQCRFPVLNIGANHLFCGADDELGKPFCPYHCGIVYIRANRPLPEQEKAAREYRRRHFQLIRTEEEQAGIEKVAPPLVPSEMVA